jgi:hypothetical protein
VLVFLLGDLFGVSFRPCPGRWEIVVKSDSARNVVILAALFIGGSLILSSCWLGYCFLFVHRLGW